MRSKLQHLIETYLRVPPIALLFVGASVALLDAALLYSAADHDRVLFIPKGVGLLQNYGLWSTLAGDAVFLYLARRYYDLVCSIRTSKALTDPDSVDEPLRLLTQMIRLDGKYIFVGAMLVTGFAIFWLSNIAIHIFGNPVEHWHHKVFDSIDHPVSFTASRLHNLYTYVIIYPWFLHVVIFTSVQVRRLFGACTRHSALHYDLLNPDGRGGFSFIEKAHMLFNIIMAILYVQLWLHAETVEHMNVEHYVTFVLTTLLLVFGNRIFLGDGRGTIDSLRIDALNATKEKVYNNDALSFDILKYCYQPRVNPYSILSFLAKALAIGFSAGLKILPVVMK